MELIKTAAEKQIWFENFSAADKLLPPFYGRPFVCVLWSNRQDYLSPELVQQLLNANCKYIVAGGENGEEWHDLADHLFISQYPDFNPPDSEHVMTTWHDGEPLDEVLWFALNNTDFAEYVFRDYLIVQIGAKYSRQHIEKQIDDILV